MRARTIRSCSIVLGIRDKSPMICDMKRDGRDPSEVRRSPAWIDWVASAFAERPPLTWAGRTPSQFVRNDRNA